MTVRQSSDKDPTLSPPDDLSAAPPPAAALEPPVSPSQPLHTASSCPAATDRYAKYWLAAPETVYSTVLPWAVYLLYMLYFKMSCVYCCELSCVYYCEFIVCIVVSCLVCIVVVVLCVMLRVVLCVLL